MSRLHSRQRQGIQFTPRPAPRPGPHIHRPLLPRLSQVPQIFQANWRPSLDYSRPRHPSLNSRITYDPTSDQQTMAVQPESAGDAKWQLQSDSNGHGEGASAWLSQASHVSSQAGQYVDGQSYFEDGTKYRAEEEALYNPFQPLSAQKNTSGLSLDMLTLPCVPSPFNSAVNNSSAAPASGFSDSIPGMPRVLTNVDTTQFEQVKGEDWGRASLDFSFDDDDFAISPTSTVDTSYGPFTPSTDTGFAVGLRRGSGDLNSDLESAEVDMFKAIGDVDLGFSSVPNFSDSIGSQFSGQTMHYGGLPFSEEGPGASGAPLVQGPFRGIDGLPPSVPVLPTLAPKIEKSDSGSTSNATTRTKRRGSSESEPESATNERDEKDKFLLDMREEGLTYKQIKKLGKFSEAESTLRGRVRVLTKDRSERVRKPVWNEEDVRIDSLHYGTKLTSKITDSPPSPRGRPRQTPSPPGRLRSLSQQQAPLEVRRGVH